MAAWRATFEMITVHTYSAFYVCWALFSALQVSQLV